MFDFSTITQWVDELLRSFLPHAAATLVEFILIGLCLLVGYAVIALVLIYVERKVCAFFQCRIGPNRVGPYLLRLRTSAVSKYKITGVWVAR